MSGVDAELHFEFEGNHGATTYRALRHDPPWKVVRGFSLPTGECLLHVNNVSGGIVGGDRLHLRATLRPGAQAQLTTTGATRLYRPRTNAGEVLLCSRFQLHHDSLLEYLPDMLIPYREARATQRSSFYLDEGAALLAWDIIAPGRVAHGERFRFDSLRLLTEVFVEGQPILLDRLLLEPALGPMHTPGRFGPSSQYLVTFLALHAGASKDKLMALESALNEHLSQHADPSNGDLWGATCLRAHGIMVRGTVSSPVHLHTLLHELWSHSKRELLGRQITSPRKTY